MQICRIVGLQLLNWYYLYCSEGGGELDKKIKALEEAGYTVKNLDGLNFKVINKQGKSVEISRENMDDYNIESILKHCEKKLLRTTQ